MTDLNLRKIKLAAEEISERARLLRLRTDAIKEEFYKIKFEPKRLDKRHNHGSRIVRRLR